MTKKDKTIIEHILYRCNRVCEIIDEYGNSLEIFVSNVDYQELTRFNLAQIGELIKKLSDEYSNSGDLRDSLKWLSKLASQIEHEFDDMDIKIIWKTAKDDIPLLKKFCEEHLEKHTSDSWIENSDYEHGGENTGVYSIREISDRVRPVAEKYGMGVVYLFGSYARGSATDESDVDLLIDRANVTGFRFFGIYDAFEEALGKPVDIVTMDVLYDQYKDDELVSELRNAIEKDRRLIYNGRG